MSLAYWHSIARLKRRDVNKVLQTNFWFHDRVHYWDRWVKLQPSALQKTANRGLNSLLTEICTVFSLRFKAPDWSTVETDWTELPQSACFLSFESMWCSAEEFFLFFFYTDCPHMNFVCNRACAESRVLCLASSSEGIEIRGLRAFSFLKERNAAQLFRGGAT